MSDEEVKQSRKYPEEHSNQEMKPHPEKHAGKEYVRVGEEQGPEENPEGEPRRRYYRGYGEETRRYERRQEDVRLYRKPGELEESFCVVGMPPRMQGLAFQK
jgi:hypothetical protein